MKNKQQNFFNPEFWFQKNPEYFNSKFFLLTLLIIGIYSLYVLISVPLYIYYHFFGDLNLLNNNNENNASLNEEFINNFRLNDISLFWNIFNNIYIIGFIALSFYILQNQTFSYLSILIILLLIFIFAYFMNINLTLIPERTSFIFNYFHLIIILTFIFHMLYFFSYKFFPKKEKNTEANTPNNKETLIGKYKIKNNERPMTIDSIVHEIQLRLDQTKIQFNSMLIKLKLHKILRSLMFKPKDYYFMQKDSKKEKSNEDIIKNIKGIKTGNKSKDIKKENVQKSETASTTLDSSIDNNYSKLYEDSETSPLNI